MTKEEITGIAFLKLEGGFPTMDSSLWWEDVDLLFGPAVNYVMTGDYFMQKRDENEEKVLQPLFIQTFKNIGITYDTDTEKWGFTLPYKPLAFPKNRAVPFVGTVLGEQFVPIEQSGGAMQQYFSGMKQCVTSYDLIGMKGTLENKPPLLEKLMVKMIVNASSLADTDEVLLPDGGELQVADLMVQFFTGQKMLPKDYYNTGKDPQTTA